MTKHNFIREMMPTARRTLLAFLVVFVVFAASPAQVRAQDPAQPRYDAALDLLMARHFSAAIEAFRALAVEYPDSKLVDDAQFHLGVCYTLLGRHDLAVMEYYRVALDYPQSDLAPEALVKAAEVLAALGFHQDAIAMFRKVLEDYPGAEPAAYAQTCIGWLYGGMGDTEKAKAEFKKVAANYPDSPYVETARESLKKLGETVLTGKVKKPEVKMAAPPPPPPVSSIIDQILLLDSIPPSPSNQKNVFSHGDTLYVWVESKILSKPHKLEIVWINPSGKEIKREKFDLRGWGARETFWSELQTGRQMMQGRWKVALLIDGRVDRSVSLTLNP